MSAAQAILLDDRGVLAVTGVDRVAFLQGLVSNDVRKADGQHAVWSAFLTAQGKYLHDFLLAADGERLLLDCEAARRGDLRRRLSLYRLRSKAALEDATESLVVAALWGDSALARLGLPPMPGAQTAFGGGIAFVDPRRLGLGARAILPRGEAAAILSAAGFTSGTHEAWDALRIAEGVPDGSRDLEVEKSILLEYGFDELGGVDWDKGCWMGQELTARTKYRALIKKRLVPVRVEGALPAPGTPVFQAAREVGELRSGTGQAALALLRLEALAALEPLRAGGADLVPAKPEWAAF